MPTGATVLVIEAMPTKAAVIALGTQNTFSSGGGSGNPYILRTAFIPTNVTSASQWSVTLASLQTCSNQSNIISVVTRQPYLQTKPYDKGFVVDVMLHTDLLPGQVVSLVVAQSGATDYGAPIPIQD